MRLSILCSIIVLTLTPLGHASFTAPVTIYTDNSIFGTNMDIKSDGTVGFVYSSDQAATIAFVEYNGTLGSSTAVNYSIFNNFGPSFAYDGDGNPFVAWYKANTRELQYNHFDGSSWQVTSASLGETRGFNSTIEVDDAGNIHALWRQRDTDFNGNRHRYRMYDKSADTWLSEQAVVNTTDSSTYRAGANLAVSGDGNAYAFTQVRPKSPRTTGTATSGPYYFEKVTDGSDFSLTQIPPNSASSNPRAGGLESTSRKVMEEAWRGSDLDLVAIQWWPTVTDTSQDTMATGYINLYLDVLGGNASPIEVWGEQGTGPSVLSSASEVDMAIDADGNHYVFFIAKDQTEATTNDVLYMQILDAAGTKIGGLETITDETTQDITSLEVDIYNSTISISYVDEFSSDVDFLYQTYLIPEPASLALVGLGALLTLSRRKR